MFRAALIVSLDVLRPLRNYATNVGLRFQTPEECFLQEEERLFVRDFDPTVFLAEGAVKSISASTS
jgi:bifunctional polynucleotide phosphatase/kinase